MNYPPRLLPHFQPFSVISRQAEPIELCNVHERRQAFKVIHEKEISKRTIEFCHDILNPILSGVNVTLVPIMNGALNFCASIISEVDQASNMELMCISARTYGPNQQSGEVVVSQDSIISEKLSGRTLVVIDDVLDTGKTATKVIELLRAQKPKRIITVFLVQKMNKVRPLISPDYCLFEVQSESWVFGYGMDLKEKYRHLKFICDENINLYNRDGSIKKR